MENHIAVFEGKKVRRIIFNNEWWFVLKDIVLSLVDSNDPKQYIHRIKYKDPELSKEWVKILIDTPGGKQKINCANTESVFRIIQSIPSSKTESFKHWLTKVGYERVQEKEGRNNYLEQPQIKQVDT